LKFGAVVAVAQVVAAANKVLLVVQGLMHLRLFVRLILELILLVACATWFVSVLTHNALLTVLDAKDVRLGSLVVVSVTSVLMVECQVEPVASSSMMLMVQT
jgi:hypothetical protein